MPAQSTQHTDERAAASDMLWTLELCVLALSLASRDCRDLPPSGERCNECVGCGLEIAWQQARAAIDRHKAP